MIKEDKYRIVKKCIGIFLMASPFIAMGIYSITINKLCHFGVAILASLAILAVVSAGVVLYTNNE